MSGDRVVAVATLHRCINHGSYWQARCLVDGLRARGHRPVILDHRSRRVDVAEWRCALRPTLPTPVPAADRPHYRRKVSKFTEAVCSLPLSARFDLHDPSVLDPFDTVVVGSDEVWNLHHPWYGGSPLFFGEGLRTRRLVSYAASFGSYDARHGVGSPWAERLGAFDALSVRDENSGDLVMAATSRRPTVVLDPCLLFPPASDSAAACAEVGTGPFVAVYGHNFSPSFAARARRWAEDRGLPLVSLSYRNDWADRQWLDAGPHDFARAMSQATAVVTNFFHGCVFALARRAPFVCESSPYRDNKVRGLLAGVGATSHLMTEASTAAQFARCLGERPDPRIDDAIAELRHRSLAYLDDALA